MAGFVPAAAASGSIGQTSQCVAAADRLLARATDAVRTQVAPHGTMDPTLLEREQRAVHGLAWLATYVEALRQMQRWARGLEELGDEPGRDRALARAVPR
jgi:(2S)-methylsuccinyl-CoA dehydrogenase